MCKFEIAVKSWKLKWFKWGILCMTNIDGQVLVFTQISDL